MMDILILAWLCVCAFFDWKQRRVPNELTLTALLLAGIARFFVPNPSHWLLTLFLLLLIATAWWNSGIGGADAKALLALALWDSRLALWAWLGAITWAALLWLITRGRQGPYHLPGFLGFVIGTFAYILLI